MPPVARAMGGQKGLANILCYAWGSAREREDNIKGVVDLLSQQARIDLVTQGFKLVNPQGWFGVAAAFNLIVFGILAVITLITNRISRATEPYYA